MTNQPAAPGGDEYFVDDDGDVCIRLGENTIGVWYNAEKMKQGDAEIVAMLFNENPLLQFHEVPERVEAVKTERLQADLAAHDAKLARYESAIGMIDEVLTRLADDDDGTGRERWELLHGLRLINEQVEKARGE